MDGSATSSWVATSIVDEAGHVMSDEATNPTMVAAGTLYAAGIDTVSRLLLTSVYVAVVDGHI